MLELFSFSIYSIISKRFFSFSTIHAKQRKYSYEEIKFENGEKEDFPLTEKDIKIIHPYLGYVWTPEKDYEKFNHTSLPVNNYGFLDDKEPIFKSSNSQIIIGILGGSVARVFSVSGVESLIKELKRSPDFWDKEIIIVRMALGGYKQPQQLIALTYLLALGAHFDIVINLDGFNEITLPKVENIPNQVFPFYPKQWFSLTTDLSDISIKVAIGEIAYLENRRKEWARLFLNTALRYSIFLNLIWEHYDTILSIKIADKELNLLNNKTIKVERYVTTGPPFVYNSEEDIYISLAEIWENCSLQMHRICTTNNIKYYHFLQPNQYVPNSKIMSKEELRQAYSQKSPYGTAVIQGYPYLIKAGAGLSEEGVYFFDLTMIFKDKVETLYVDDMCHLNRRGNEILGEIMGRIIIENQNIRRVKK